MYSPPTAPVVVLCAPQLGENIGAAARAMANFGLSDLRLVAPRDGWPNPKAEAMAAGAGSILNDAKLFASVSDAVGELRYVLATTARDRSMSKEILTPAEGALRLRAKTAAGARCGILFGNERAGLTNDEVARADAVVTVPTGAGFRSLNLGQAVLLIAYEWFRSGDTVPASHIDHGAGLPAPRDELFLLFEHLEDELEKSGFLFPPGNRPGMIRNLRAILHRASLTDQEVRTLRGVITALTRGKRRRSTGNTEKE